MSVYNILYEGRKHQVKPATPNTLLQALAQEAAIAFGIDSTSASLSLKLKQKALNLADSVRFAGIPNHSNLDLVVTHRASGVASSASQTVTTTIHLNINSGSQQATGTVTGNLTLWDMLLQLVAAGVIAQVAVDNLQELLYIRTAFASPAQLQQTHLQALGVLGQAVKFQLRYREIVETSSTASASAVEYSNETPQNISQNIAQNISQNIMTTTNVQPIVPAESVAEAPSTQMDVDVPVVALSAADAVHFMLHNNFDAVSKLAVSVLTKYVHNLLTRWTDTPAVRSISMQNKVFVEKIAPVKGAVDVLLAAGFVKMQNEERLIFPENDQKSLSLAKNALQALQAAMDELQMTEEERPVLTVKHSHHNNGNNNNNVVLFDPFKPLIVRPALDGRTQGDAPAREVLLMDRQGSSMALNSTEEQLRQLSEQRRQLQGPRGSVSRHSWLLYPGDLSYNNNNNNNSSNSSMSEEANGGGGGGLPRSVLQRTLKALSGDGSSDAPLTTRALRDLQRLKEEKIYREVVIRVRLSNQLQFLGRFHPCDTVSDVYHWLARVCLSPTLLQTIQNNNNNSSNSNNSDLKYSGAEDSEETWQREQAEHSSLSPAEEMKRFSIAMEFFSHIGELYTAPPRQVFSPSRTNNNNNNNNSNGNSIDGDGDSAADVRSPSLSEVGWVPAIVLNLQWKPAVLPLLQENEKNEKYWYVHPLLQAQAGAKNTDMAQILTLFERPKGVSLLHHNNNNNNNITNNINNNGSSEFAAAVGSLDASSDAKQAKNNNNSNSNGSSSSKPKWFKL